MRDTTCRREKSEVALDGEIRPRVERRGFDLAFLNGPHYGQARIPSLLWRPGLFVRGRSVAEILPCELVLLLGQLQRVGLLPLGVELGLQGRDLLFQDFDLGIALRSGVEALYLPLHGPVGLGGPLCGVIRRCRLLGGFESVVQQRERVVAECHHASLLLFLAAELFRGFAFVSDGGLRLAVRDRRIDPRGSLLGLDGCRPEYMNLADGNLTSSIILFPQTVASLPLVVNYKGQEYHATLTMPEGALLAGNNYTYTVKVRNKVLEVSEATIAKWNDIDGGDVGADL